MRRVDKVHKLRDFNLIVLVRYVLLLRCYVCTYLRGKRNSVIMHRLVIVYNGEIRSYKDFKFPSSFGKLSLKIVRAKASGMRKMIPENQ